MEKPSDSNGNRTLNHLVRKRTLKPWLNVRLWTKWLLGSIPITVT